MTDLTYGAAEDGSRRYKGMYPTVGASDEFIRLFLFRKTVTQAELRDLQGRLTGCVEEGEVISTQVRLTRWWLAGELAAGTTAGTTAGAVAGDVLCAPARTYGFALHVMPPTPAGGALR